MKNDFRYSFTVFTATYNRAHLLPRVCECLAKQTFTDFEWLIVDDGSTDNTREVVAGLQGKVSFPVRYVAKPNGGKHTAINRAAQEAAGCLIATLDSDDWYVPNSLERFWFHWQAIPAANREQFVGVTALCAYETGELIGTKFPEDVFDSDAIDLRYKFRVQGEKGGVLRTEILKRYPFPEDVGKFISESVIWNRIAKKYKTRFVNEVLTMKEFQADGLTNTGRLNQVKNAQASLFAWKELILLGSRLPLKERVRGYSNYVRHSLHLGVPFGRQAAEAPSKAMFLLCYSLGAYLKNRDASLLAEEQKRQLAKSTAN